VSSTSDHGSDFADTPAFSIAGVNVRQVTVRNAPSVINAVFNFRNFWDGRASNIFTGQTPFGESDSRRNALVWNDGRLAAENLRIDNSSLASQAVGPPVNSVEMSYDGRTWPKLGRRMLALRPLALQRVAADDSVLGALANSQGRGLAPQFTYLGLIQAAFQPEYWSAAPQAASEFTQAEFNFAMFFGLAVQAYETTLVSDDTRFDRFSQGDSDALTSEERAGLQLFRTRGNCDNCHGGAEFTLASVSSVNRRTAMQPAGRNGPIADTGFFRTGVRPVADDIGLGGKDDFGNPLSISAAQNPAARLNVDGTFKTPQLRNVEFTGPFFHNGGQATLEQVVEFYSRGADFGGNLGNGIRRLNLNATDRAALVAFMKALSDDRVRYEGAPFDHPELCVPIGHVEVLPSILQPQLSDPRFRLSAADKWAGIPAVGRQGNAAPLQTFDELLQGIGTDGARAHTLTDVCTVP
jgi:cytochrome c peroxidase